MNFSKNIFFGCYRKHKNKPVKILISMYNGNYHRFLLSALFYIIKHSPTWLMPIVIANIVNTVMYKSAQALEIILMNAIIIGSLVLINIPMNYLHIHFSSKVIRYVEAGLRSALVRKLQQLSISYHKETQSGRLHLKVMRDVEAVQVLSSQVFVSLLNVFINITIVMMITVVNNPVVFLFFLLTIPIASITIVAFRTKIKEQNRRFRHKIEVTSAKLMDMEEMIPLTRAHGLEKVEVKRMEKLIQNISEEGYRLDIIQANFGSVSWAIFQFFQIGCLVFTAYLVLNKRIQAGDIVLYQSYFTTVVNQVSGLIMLLPTIAKGMESVVSIGEVINEYDVEDNDGKLILKGLEGRYQFNNVSFAYNQSKKHVLENFNLEVKAGETIAFVGESGAGKSTLMNLLIGFNLIDQGKVQVDGYDMREIDLHSYRKWIAVVPQETVLFSGTIKENIMYGLTNITDDKFWKVIKASNLSNLLESLPEGEETFIGEQGSRLSGGQKQRIAIARAMIRDPRVILFDEATSALDSISENLILEAMDKLIQDRTTFIVAHRLSTIRKADKICILKKGTCVEHGTFDELMAKKGEFYQMKILQQ